MAAGGMGRRRGPTLAERSHVTGAVPDREAAPGDAPDPRPDPRRPGPRRRHCWVAGPGDRSGPWPGLVIEWHHDAGGWRARVVYVVGEPDSATTVETWVDATHLRPAEPKPP
jgi:hypothetical protein